ncbi:MAG: hypothetical protein AAGA77_26075 [Bacteroidota bacterium]
MRQIRLVLVLCLFSCWAMGQVSVAVSANTDTIYFGDEVELTIKLNVPNGVDVTSLDFTPIKECLNLIHHQMPAELDSIMDIDLLDGGAFNIDNDNLIATKEGLNGAIPKTGIIRLRVTSTGVLDLPRPRIGYLSGEEEMLLTTARLFVKPREGMEDINPNWGIIEEERSWKDYLWYVYVVFGVLGIGAGVFALQKYLKRDKREEVVEEEKIKLPAHAIAIKDLDELKSKQLWQNGDTKGYHTELTRIMRQYLEDRFEINALEMTSSQLKRELKKVFLLPEIVMRIDDILQIADKVKFAKGNAGPEINERFMEEAYKIVDETKIIKKEQEDV